MPRPAFHRAAATLFAAAWVVAPARAADALRPVMAELSRDLNQFLDRRGVESISVNAFAGPPNFPTSAGPSLAQMLSEELRKVGVRTRSGATLGVAGEYQAAEATDAGSSGRKMLALAIKARVQDETGHVLTDVEFDRTVPGEEAFVEVMGPPVALPPRATPEARDRKLRESLVRPRTAVNGARVAAVDDARLAVEIEVDGRPRVAREEDGLAFVTIDRGEAYRVRLINDTDQEMAVTLSIDGLSMYAFSQLRREDGPHKGDPRFRYVFVGPHKAVAIDGWHKTNKRSLAFLVTSYPESAAATLDHRAGLGTITATFHAAWPKASPPPADEPGRTKGVYGGDATGFGPPMESRFREVERNVGVLRASVSVHYSK